MKAIKYKFSYLLIKLIIFTTVCFVKKELKHKQH